MKVREKRCSTSESGNHTQWYCILKNGIRMAKKSKWACARKRRIWLNSSRKQLELFTGHTRKTGFGWILFDLLQFVVEQMILIVSDTRIVVTVARLLISFFFLAVCCCMAVCWWLPTSVHCTKLIWLYERYLPVIEENSFAFAHIPTLHPNYITNLLYLYTHTNISNPFKIATVTCVLIQKNTHPCTSSFHNFDPAKIKQFLTLFSVSN